jgi:hypothetical protein
MTDTLDKENECAEKEILDDQQKVALRIRKEFSIISMAGGPIDENLSKDSEHSVLEY